MFGLDFVGKEIDAHFASRQVRRDVWTDENLTEFSSPCRAQSNCAVYVSGSNRDRLS